ncbi:MAG: uroporphyrinogen-III synthase [Betaproteobacteria bacterium]|nr:uroporphyrinogen-III synthase [Betaproteobacteria bacterium]
MARNKSPLAGRGIVVTRPAHLAGELVRRIRAAGGSPILFPVLEIRDVTDPGPLDALIARLDEFDLAIFISPNAAEKAMHLITARRELPAKLAVAAIGGGGVRALERHGVTGVIAPAGRYDSEALLEQPALAAVKGKRVVIFRGEGGRELLGDTLKARGALVEYAVCYRRGRPDADAAPLLAAWAGNKLDAITATSSESVRNLHDMVGPAGRERLRQTPLFVPHPRIAEAARGLGLARLVVTGAGDEGLVAGLTDYFKDRE